MSREEVLSLLEKTRKKWKRNPTDGYRTPIVSLTVDFKFPTCLSVIGPTGSILRFKGPCAKSEHKALLYTLIKKFH